MFIRGATGCELRIAVEKEHPVYHGGLIYLGDTEPHPVTALGK